MALTACSCMLNSKYTDQYSKKWNKGCLRELQSILRKSKSTITSLQKPQV